MSSDKPLQPASGPAVWHGRDFSARSDWIVRLGEAEVAELERAADAIRRGGLRPDEAAPSDFLLPTVASVLQRGKEALGSGCGFVLIRGLPMADYTPEELGIIFRSVGAFLGISVSQSADGDRLGHVIDRGRTDRYYTAGGPIEFHMDPVDVVGLLCIRGAMEGGASRIVSSGAVHNLLLAERPDLLALLYRGFYCSRRGHGDDVTGWRVPVYARTENGVESYFLPITIRQAEEEGHPLDEHEREALAYIQEVASRPEIFLDMDFRPGDMQFLNNRVIFHARTDYRDYPDPALRRHLLRLWLMMPDWPPRHETMSLHEKTDRAGGGVRSG